MLAATLVAASPGAVRGTLAQVAVDGTPDGGSEATAPTGPQGGPLVGETVVTASRAPRLRTEVPADVTVLERTDLEQSASPLLDDVLRKIPDVGTFRRSSSRVADPSSQGLNLRGVGPSAVSRALVLVDGLPLNDPFGGWVYWQSVPGLSIGSVEIVPGGSSVLYGTTALGGVINVRSRPLDVAGAEADVGGHAGLLASLACPCPLAGQVEADIDQPGGRQNPNVAPGCRADGEGHALAPYPLRSEPAFLP